MLTKKGENTRKHIIRISANLFNHKGYAGTSMSDILDAAGYSKGALYRTFSDKEELSKEAFKYNFSVIEKTVSDAMDKEKTGKGKLFALTSFYSNGKIGKYLQGGCPILNTAIEADDTNPDLNHLVQKAFSSYRKKVEEAIRFGMEAGEFDKTLNYKEVATFIVSTIEGSVALTKVYKDGKLMHSNMKLLKAYIDKL